MVVELLRFTIPAPMREEFIACDARIWNDALSSHSGFVSKELWADLHDLTQVVIKVHWETYEQWKSFPLDLNAALNAQMCHLYTSVTCEEYELRGEPVPARSRV